MRLLPARMPDTDRRQVIRIPAQPFIRVDRNDYSIDPAFAGRHVGIRVSQTEITAVVLDSRELAARHRRVANQWSTQRIRTSWSVDAMSAANATRSTSRSDPWLATTS